MKNKVSIIGASAIGSYGLLKLPQSKVDPYTRSVIGGVAGGTIFLTGVIYQNPLIKWFGIGVMVGSALTLEEVARIKGGKLVSNKFDGSVFVLYESEGVKELQPFEKPNFSIDGLTVKGLNGVFKVRDGVYTKIDSSGKIYETIGIGKVVNQLSDAGFKDKSWCDKIASQGDSRWLNLFERSV
jgi:hypothetical protein